MIRADLEILFSLLIVGYYIYTFVAKNKEKKTAPSAETAQPGKKKKSFLEELMEELEKQQKANQPTTTPPPLEPVLQKPPPKDRPRQKQKPERKPAPQPVTFSLQEEGGFTTMSSTLKSAEKPVVHRVKGPSKIKLGNTVLSPRDAVVAQIIFERRF